MNTAHKYILEPYKGMNTRYSCPSCQKRGKTFSLYIDSESGEFLHSTVGRCNREINCGHHYTPKQYFQDNNISFDNPQPKVYTPRPVTNQLKPVSFIPIEVFKASLKAHKTNHFVQYLIKLFRSGNKATVRPFNILHFSVFRFVRLPAANQIN